MSVFEETFNPAALTRTDTSSSITKSTSISASKPTKATPTFPRVDFEPLYTELKSLISHDWAVYHDALTRFLRGELSSLEFGDLTDHFILASAGCEHAHNVLICAILFNASRDSPEPGMAAWVSAATDKTAGVSSSKPAITKDAGEQRLKTEIKELSRRERKRLKTAAGEKSEDEPAITQRSGYEDYYAAGRIKAPDAVPATAGGLNKTNWELEIRKRYAQPLFAESQEFPDANTIHARIVPICYEEAVGSGTSVQCAEFVGIAAEAYLKGFMQEVFDRTRANGPKYENSAGSTIFTSRYKRTLLKEEAAFKAGKLQRNRDDELLPTESKVALNRKPLSTADLQLANCVGPSLWTGYPLIGMAVQEALPENEQDDWSDREYIPTVTNGHVTDGDDAMDLDEEDDDYGWEGTGLEDRGALGSLLEDCLSIRA